jgi:hypothetical protein
MLPPPAIREIIEDVLRPGHFYLGPDVDLEWTHQTKEEVFWEIFKGRLLDSAHTRKRQGFEAWNVFWLDAGVRSEEPIISLKLDSQSAQLHVVRAIHCYVWEGYDAGGSVYLSRERTKWVRELMATVDLSSFPSPEELRDELIGQVFNVVVGTGRLALISIEMPLPAFMFGQLGYFYRPELPLQSKAMRGCRELIDGALNPELSWRGRIKLLETVLRTTGELGASTPRCDELATAADLFATRWRKIDKEEASLLALLRGLFEEVSLTPYTDFVEKFLIFLDLLTQKGHISTEARIDFLSYVLRHVGRHLTAYDFVTFHHRGANYPDALLLDAALKTYLKAIEDSPELFAEIPGEAPRARTRKQIRRRALRQAWLLRRQYEGHPVPEVPTSPGENNRVLPPSHVRVPENQILNPSLRTKRLFADDAIGDYLGEHAKEILRQSVADLRGPADLQEMGMALFLDRPLGVSKAPGERDQTLLFSYETFSRAIAERRLHFLAENLGLVNSAGELAELVDALQKLVVSGIPLGLMKRTARPGAVSLADAFKVADDFVFLRTTKRSLTDFFSLYRFETLAGRLALKDMTPNDPLLILRDFSDHDLLFIYDAKKRRRLELQIDPSGDYANRAGVEYPGLRVVRAWQEDGSPAGLDLEEEERLIPIAGVPAKAD